VSVTVGGDSSDLGDLLTGGDVALVLLEVVDNGIDSGLDTATEVHGVAAGSNVLHGLGEDSTSENGSSGGTVTGEFVGLGSDILEEASTEVLELVLKLDSLGHGHTVLGDLGRAIRRLDEDVTTLGTKRRSHRLRKSINTLEELGTSFNTELELLVSETLLLEVETGRSVERSALGSGREDRSPRRESTLHVEQGRMKDSRRLRRRTADEKDNGSIPNTTSRARTGEEEEKDGRRGCEEGRRDILGEP
jgi:hypothetical protein